MIRTALCALALAACGSHHAAPASGESHEMMQMESHMTPEMRRFHDVLAPRWHAAQGPQRVKDTCAAVGDFRGDAEAIANATPPRGANADTWTTATKQLVAAVDGLAQVCAQGEQPAGFEDAFARVHQAFHAVLAAGMEMPAPGSGHAS